MRTVLSYSHSCHEALSACEHHRKVLRDLSEACSTTMPASVFCLVTLRYSCVLVWSGIQDPVDASPAVLVKRYNITQHKELEIQLATRQGDLLR